MVVDSSMNFAVNPETELERQLVSDGRWRTGSSWGVPRPGHPEGQVLVHIVEVLANLDKLGLEPDARAKLRIVALIHDTFKGEVNRSLPRVGANHHAAIARKFAEGFTDDLDVLEIVELHDEAYNSWRLGASKKEWGNAQTRATTLIERLGSRLPLYIAFYRADNAAGDKSPEQIPWFEGIATKTGYLPDRQTQFRACYVDDATCVRAGHADVPLTIETRYRTDDSVELFTVHEGIEHRSTDLLGLAIQLLEVQELHVSHVAPIELLGRVVNARFTEVYRPSPTENYFEDTVKAILEVDADVWQSTWCASLMEAIYELHADAPEWRFRTCLSCGLAGYASDYLNTDREFWCYRDAPDAIAESGRSGQYSRGTHRFKGIYFVRAFHRCAAWRPRPIHPTSSDAAGRQGP
jgi:hypothetical protein